RPALPAALSARPQSAAARGALRRRRRDRPARPRQDLGTVELTRGELTAGRAVLSLELLSMRFAIACALCLPLLSPATSRAEEAWETVVTGPPITVKTRAREGTNIKEIWAEGEIDASLLQVQEVLTDPESFPKYMPYVKESRI